MRTEQMKLIKNGWNHFRTISEHKWVVMQECFQVGLYKQGLLHDLSKYTPEEFKTGIYYFQGDRSPNAAEKEEKGYSGAWLHHKGRNRHHYEYWIDLGADRSEGLQGMKMPLKYVIEMFMDRIAASKTYMGKDYSDQHPLQYYERGAARLGKMIHPETAALLHRLLLMLAEKGEEATFRFIREHKRELKKGRIPK